MAQKKTWIARYWWLALIAGGLLVACTAAAIAAALIIPRMTNTSQDHSNPIISDSSSNSPGGVSTSSGGDTRLPVQLSAGQEGPQPTEIVPVVIGEPLSDEQVEEIFARLPTLIPDDADQVDFKIPDEPLPPPRTGDTIDETFPPTPPPVEVAHIEPGPLEVLRFSPEGEIALAPFVSVTFNQPMVPLTTIEDLAAGEVPLRIEPALPGTWRWVGTKTLTFQYDSVEIDRLPKATDYILTVPAGTESATGGVLAETVSWSFRTPPPLVTDHSPSRDPLPLDPTFYFAFDQHIDSQAVLDTIAVTAGDQTFNLELVEMEDIPRIEQLNRRIENAGEGRWLAFRATELLPVDSTISIAIGPGT
ncbi:MAG: Ig-like domain-containing protein, partial [Anaerolineales bacterium]|nr:Ig-like domain-containing protein [Anaerolineales bacterium]